MAIEIPSIWIGVFCIAVVVVFWAMICSLWFQPLIERFLRHVFRVPDDFDDLGERDG